MSTLYMVWIATDDDGKAVTHRILFQATTDRQRAMQAARTIDGTITFTTEWTAEQFNFHSPDVP